MKKYLGIDTMEVPRKGEQAVGTDRNVQEREMAVVFYQGKRKKFRKYIVKDSVILYFFTVCLNVRCKSSKIISF